LQGDVVEYESNDELYWHIGEDDVGDLVVDEEIKETADEMKRSRSHGGCQRCLEVMGPGEFGSIRE
jgi:hypothetical protein